MCCPYAAKNDIATLAYGPLCRGLLAGKMNADSTFTGDDLRRNDPKFQPPRFAQYLAAVAALEAFAKNNYGKTVLDLAIRWVLDRQAAEHRSLGRPQTKPSSTRFPASRTGSSTPRLSRRSTRFSPTTSRIRSGRNSWHRRSARRLES